MLPETWRQATAQARSGGGRRMLFVVGVVGKGRRGGAEGAMSVVVPAASSACSCNAAHVSVLYKSGTVATLELTRHMVVRARAVVMRRIVLLLLSC